MTTILIAEDEAPIREMLTDALLAEGYAVVAVGDGEAALDQIARECPALVITDNMMPGLSGAALIARLHSGPTPPPPILLMSAVAPPQAACASVPFLPKPFDLVELFSLVETMAGQAH